MKLFNRCYTNDIGGFDKLNKHQIYRSSIFKKQIGHARFCSISNLELIFNSAASRFILSTSGEYFIIFNKEALNELNGSPK